MPSVDDFLKAIDFQTFNLAFLKNTYVMRSFDRRYRLSRTNKTMYQEQEINTRHNIKQRCCAGMNSLRSDPPSLRKTFKISAHTVFLDSTNFPEVDPGGWFKKLSLPTLVDYNNCF